MHIENIESSNTTLRKVTNFIYQTYLNMQYKPKASMSIRFLGTRYASQMRLMKHESNQIESKILANWIKFFISESPSSIKNSPLVEGHQVWKVTRQRNVVKYDLNFQICPLSIKLHNTFNLLCFDRVCRICWWSGQTPLQMPKCWYEQYGSKTHRDHIELIPTCPMILKVKVNHKTG